MISNSKRHAVLAAIIGAVAFLLADAVEARYWGWFAGDARFSPWFLNAGRAALLTATCVLVAGALAGAGASGLRQKTLQCLFVTAGACIAMAAVLFARGPGTIFPIVLVFGGGALFVSAVLGIGVSFALRR